MTDITTLTTRATVRAHNPGWFTVFVDTVLSQAESYAAENEPDIIAIDVPVVTLDSQLLGDNVLGAFRRLITAAIEERKLDLEIAAIEQELDDERMLHVIITIYT